jgi:hypothetical protein
MYWDDFVVVVKGFALGSILVLQIITLILLVIK